MKIYTDKDADLAVLKGKTCAVLGFGSQGHAHALNLKESGVKVIIGLYPGSKSRAVAAEKGFPVFDTAEAVKKADVIFVAVPDTKQPDAFEKDIRPNLKKGQTLVFSHGFSIHFKTLVPPTDIDVIMVAPKANDANNDEGARRKRFEYLNKCRKIGWFPVKDDDDDD